MKARIIASFYVIDGEIPILIGNDILELLGGIIHTDEKRIEFRRLGLNMRMKKTGGGHYTIPVMMANDSNDDDITEYFDVANDEDIGTSLDEERSEDVNGSEADAILLIMLSECQTEDDLVLLHEVVGHSNLVALALEWMKRKRSRKFIDILVIKQEDEYGNCSQKQENCKARKRLYWNYWINAEFVAN